MEEQAPYRTNRPTPIIDPKELRIGNLIKARDINQFRIDEICLSEYGEYIFRMYPAFPDKKSCIHLQVYMAEPIQLTEEILLKAGFKKLNWGIVTYYNPLFELDSNFVARGVDYNLKVETVHQLQNLYFVLTGKELEIKL